MIIFSIGTLLLLAFLAWATYRTAQVLRAVKFEQNLLLMPAENMLRVVLIVICFGLALISEQPSAVFGWQTHDFARDVVLGLAAGLIGAFSLPIITRGAIARFGRRIYSPVVVLSVLPRQRDEWFAIPFALATAVLLEEFLFRALLLGGFAAFAPPLALALAWSVLFGAMHVSQGALGMIVAAALGFLFSILFLLTSSLLAPFLAHYAINLWQIAWAARDKTWLENYDTDPGSHS
ncbi:MAG: CPBP family intramembrane metalloprotease [Chloroflexi bacterium]|nr:CPBP family intramembrane metalloprotease [Chloroflexota bacterium]